MRCRIVFQVMLACLAAWAVCAHGADDLPVDVDAAVSPAEEPGDSATNLQTLATETIALMQQAQADFSAARLTDDGAARQNEINEKLKRLLTLLEQQSSAGSSGREESSGRDASSNAASGGGEGAVTQQLDAAESSESATGEKLSQDGNRKAVRDMATSVWGHLPPRERDRMQSRFSERFLPQYDSLVRQYYEALAAERLSDK